VDLPRGVKSGLVEALDVLKGVEGISVVRFKDTDVVRHPLVGRIVQAYDALYVPRPDDAPVVRDDTVEPQE
jgi:phosphate starvation-inducible PhoH-like protein